MPKSTQTEVSETPHKSPTTPEPSKGYMDLEEVEDRSSDKMFKDLFAKTGITPPQE